MTDLKDKIIKVLIDRVNELEAQLHEKRKFVELTEDELAEALDINLGNYDLCLEIEGKLKEKNT